jgi:hypothetical protein
MSELLASLDYHIFTCALRSRVLMLHLQHEVLDLVTVMFS